MGVWSLNYDPTVIKVFAGGGEILPGKLNLEQGLVSSQQITLTIIGVSGGNADISARWNVWTDPEAPLGRAFNIGGEQDMGIQAVNVDIDTDSNNDGTIDHFTDNPVEDQDLGRVMNVHADGYDDLAEVDIRFTGISYYPLSAGHVIGELTATGDIRVWADQGMTTLLASPGQSKTWDLYSDVVPSTVYVEGLTPGDSQLSWTVIVNGNELNTDSVKFKNIKIDIKKDGQIITNTTVDVVVGQKMSLTAEIQGRNPQFPIYMPYYSWDITNGTAVKDYKQTPNRGYIVDFSNQDYNKKKFVFYWIAGSNQNSQVELTLSFGPFGVKEDAWFNVLRPMATLTETPTSDRPEVDVSNPGFPGSGLELHFGSFNSPGMTWNGSVTTTNCTGGEIQLVQLINTDSRSTEDGTDFRWKITTDGAYVLDPNKNTGAVEYGKKPIDDNATVSFQSDDTPGAALFGYNYYYCSDQFEDYLMYRPTGGIWVTLKVSYWSWDGTAVMNLETGHWACTGFGYSFGPSSDSTELPIWENSITSIGRMPDNS